MYWNSFVGLDDFMSIQTGRGIGVEMSYSLDPVKNDALFIEIGLS